MKLEYLITMTDSAMKLRFLAMVRSLRATGCTLPVLVIPYSENLFDLPPGCEYFRHEKIFQWLQGYPAAAVKRKYCVLTLKNYQFVDSDVVFLKNPETVLSDHGGFVTCCGHWRDATHVATPDLERVLRSRTSLWQRLVFNSGQFACDQPLYSAEELITASQGRNFQATVLDHQFHEQPGINLLVLSTSVRYTNLTLPPFDLESSWAGDYVGDSTVTRGDEGPYLIHWAGMPRGRSAPLDELYLQFLSSTERTKLIEQESEASRSNHFSRIIRSLWR